MIPASYYESSMSHSFGSMRVDESIPILKMKAPRTNRMLAWQDSGWVAAGASNCAKPLLDSRV